MSLTRYDIVSWFEEHGPAPARELLQEVPEPERKALHDRIYRAAVRGLLIADRSKKDTIYSAAEADPVVVLLRKIGPLPSKAVAERLGASEASVRAKIAHLRREGDVVLLATLYRPTAESIWGLPGQLYSRPPARRGGNPHPTRPAPRARVLSNVVRDWLYEHDAPAHFDEIQSAVGATATAVQKALERLHARGAAMEIEPNLWV